MRFHIRVLTAVILLLTGMSSAHGDSADTLCVSPPTQATALEDTVSTADLSEVEPKESLYYMNDPRMQFPSRHLILPLVKPDSADVARAEQKHFWRGAAETFGLNMGLWAVDRYIQHGQYAYISFKTIAANFRHGFSWDNDHLSTNMFAHPYNGSLYYNAGRSNGYNFWQSGMFAIAGSAMWELFMEKEYPSTNDIIATPVGGAALGEVFYRTSDLFLDDSSTGWERFGREFADLLIDPMRGLTRIFSGDAWRHRVTSGRRFGYPPLSLQVSLGMRALIFHDGRNLSKVGATALINLEYGDRYSPKSHKPYDYFNVAIELDAISTQPILNRLEIKGRLISRDIVDTRSTDLSIGLYQHFDYFDSDTITLTAPDNTLRPCIVPYKLGTPASIGCGLMYRYVDEPVMSFEAYTHLNAVFMAGVLSDYYRYYHRNYNWASGFAIKTGVTLNFPKLRFNFTVANRLYRLYTWSGDYREIHGEPVQADRARNIQGDKSNAWFSYLEARFNFRIWRRLYASVGVDWYYRLTKYHDLSIYQESIDASPGVFDPKIRSQQLGVYLTATYEF